jgi:hypothetical protein
MANRTWADRVTDPSVSPGRPTSDTIISLIGSPEVKEAAEAVRRAEKDLLTYPSATESGHDRARYAVLLRARDDAVESFCATRDAAAANRAAAATPAEVSPPAPVFDERRNTHVQAQRAYERTRHEMQQIRQMLSDFEQRLPAIIRQEQANAASGFASEAAPGIAAQSAGIAAQPAATSADPPIVGASGGKHPPPPPKYNGDKGEGKVSINAWLLHFLEWCNLYSVPTSKWVAHAILALEGAAIETWYSRKQQLLLEGKDPNCWATFKADMISKYAEVSPDLFVRSNLAALRQGTGTVQAYHDKFRAIVSQADKHPVAGAEAVWHFKQGLSERVRTAIAAYEDDDLDTMVLQAKRVDAAHQLERVHPVPSKQSSSGVGTKRPATVTGGSGSGPKRARGDKPLWSLRIGNGICSNCRQTKEKHLLMGCDMGRNCTAAFVPPTKEENDILAKGKGKVA